MRRLGAAIALATTLGALAAAADDAPRGWLGVSTQTAKEVPKLPDGLPPYRAALEIVIVYPGSPGEAAGLIDGDIVLALDGEPFDRKDGDPAAQYRKRLLDRKPGERVELLVLHSKLTTTTQRDGKDAADTDEVTSDLAAALKALPAGGRLEVQARRDTVLLRLPLVLGTHPDDRPPRRVVVPNGAIHPDLTGRQTPLGAIVDTAVQHYDWSADTADLRQRLARIAASDDGFLLDDVRFVMREPTLMPEVATHVLDSLAPRTRRRKFVPGTTFGVDLPARIQAAASLDFYQEGRVVKLITGGMTATMRADLEAPKPFDPSSLWRPAPSLATSDTAEGYAKTLADLLAETAALREQAFAPLTADDRAFLAANASGLAALEDTIYLFEDGNAARRKKNLRLLDIAAKVDRRPLYQAALSWSRLSDEKWLASLRSCLAHDPRAGKDYILRMPTPQGEIVFGGSGRNRYRDMEPAIVVDLGGDDIYSDNAGSSSWDKRPCAAVIDFAGNDAYEATDSFVQGTGLGGVGLLLDLAGDDRYIAGDFAQGCGLLGVGMVVDVAGNDTWRARHLAQGCAIWGAGFLVDASGNDTYESLGLAQGLGLPGGFGVAHDMAGDDRWYAKGGPITGYGTQGVFDAHAQGCGLGLRALQSGGIGVLADDDGRDDFEAGSFAQGGGYFHGWGLLRAGGHDDDSYVGSRYGQGFAAHAALGTFIEEGGNDRYATRHGVIAGLAWDECVTYFLDASGNDTYLTDFFSLGATAHNAFAFFVDAGGSDVYEGQEVARSGGNDYHGGTSLSLFLDLGMGRDTYEGTFASGKIETNGEHGVAIDLPGDLEHLAGGGLAAALAHDLPATPQK